MLGSFFGYDPFASEEGSAAPPQAQGVDAPRVYPGAQVGGPEGQGSAGFPSHMSTPNLDGPMTGQPSTTPSGYSILLDVDNPMRSSGMMPHIQYRVRCKTDLPGYSGGVITVWRRFSDFEWLRNRLRQTHPGVIIPPIPEKTVLNFDDPQHSVIIERVFMLKWFLQQVAAHAALVESEELRSFLESNHADMQEWFERGYMGEALAGANAMLGSFSSSMRGDGAGKPVVNLTDGEIEAMYPTPHWDINDDAVIRYLTQAEEALQLLCQTTEKVADQHDEQARALFAFANGLSQMGAAEDKTTEVISAWALETGATRSKVKLNIGGFGSYMRDYIIGSYKEQGPSINYHLYLALKKGHLLTKAAKEMLLDHQDAVKARKHAIMMAVGKKRVMEQIKGVHIETFHPEVVTAVNLYEAAEDARREQEQKIQSYGQLGRKELLKFLSTRSEIISPALKAFTKLQGRLAGHTAAAIIEFRNLHVTGAGSDLLKEAQQVPVPVVDIAEYAKPPQVVSSGFVNEPGRSDPSTVPGLQDSVLFASTSSPVAPDDVNAASHSSEPPSEFSNSPMPKPRRQVKSFNPAAPSYAVPPPQSPERPAPPAPISRTNPFEQAPAQRMPASAEGGGDDDDVASMYSINLRSER